MKCILFYSRLDYESNKEFASWIIAEFEKNGVEVALVFLEDFYVARKLHFEPDFIINRTREYNLSVLFEFNGVRSFNNSNVVLIGNNKYSCYKFIEKPIAGHGGENITLSTNAIFKRDYIYQEFIPNVIGDLRFYVIVNKIIRSVLRCKPAGSILCNYKHGAEIQLYEASPEQFKIVTKLIDSIGIVDFVGIDFFLTEDGKFILNEIEDVVGSRMLSALGCNNTVPLYVEHILRCMNN